MNRRKVFIRGTNWIPEAMQRTDYRRMEREIRLTAESGVNMLRLWAGGIVESDRFYELCDEYGILVWQEFFLTADTCQPEDRALYLDNVAQQVKRIRNHPLWECWNMARNHATGILFWYNNTPMPQLGSHAWDYDLNQDAAFFAQRNALEPLHAQYEYVSNRVAVVSDIVTDKYLSVKAEVYDFNTEKIWERAQPIDVPAERCVFAFRIPFERLAVEHPQLSRPHFIKLRLLIKTMKDGKLVVPVHSIIRTTT